MPKEIARMLDDSAIRAASLVLDEGIRQSSRVRFRDFLHAMDRRGFDRDTSNMVLHRAVSMGDFVMTTRLDIERPEPTVIKVAD